MNESGTSAKSTNFQIERPFYNENTLNTRYSFRKLKVQTPLSSAKRYMIKNYKPSRSCMKRYFKDRFPIIKWGREYKFKEFLFRDVVGGLTIGVVQIPQSMAYSLMAGLPPVNGLYVSFISMMIYLFLGTSHHLSMGTYGVVSIMVKQAIEKYEHKNYINNDDNGLKSNLSSSLHVTNNDDLSNIEERVLIASALSLFAGLFHVRIILIFKHTHNRANYTKNRF